MAERFYAAALAPELWSDVLPEMLALFGARHGFLTAGFDAGGPLLQTTAGIDPHDLLRSVEAQKSFDDGRRPQLALPESGIYLRSDLVPDRDYLRSAHYNEVVRPLGGFFAIAAGSAISAGGFNLGLCRPESGSEFEAPERSAADALLPHLIMALEFARRLAHAERQEKRAASFLDHLDGGVILTDASARDLGTNARAARLLEEHDGLSFERNGLSAAVPVVTARLRDAIAATAGSQLRQGNLNDGVESRRLSLPRPSGRLPLQLDILPAWRLDWPGLGKASVVILVHEPDAAPMIDRTTIADVFGMTSREIDVAILLAGGKDLAAIGSQLGLTRESVRIYLKRAFAKTGTHNQAGLVALMRGFGR